MSDYNVEVGGDVIGASISIGDNARSGAVISGDPVRQHAIRALDEFIAAVRNCDAHTPGVTEVQDDVAEVKREVAASNPDKRAIRERLTRIQAWLAAIGSAVIGAGALADALDKIWDAIGHL